MRHGSISVPTALLPAPGPARDSENIRMLKPRPRPKHSQRPPTQAHQISGLVAGGFPFLGTRNSNSPLWGTNSVVKSWHTPLMPAGRSEFEANLVYRTARVKQGNPVPEKGKKVGVRKSEDLVGVLVSASSPFQATPHSIAKRTCYRGVTGSLLSRRWECGSDRFQLGECGGDRQADIHLDLSI